MKKVPKIQEEHLETMPGKNKNVNSADTLEKKTPDYEGGTLEAILLRVLHLKEKGLPDHKIARKLQADSVPRAVTNAALQAISDAQSQSKNDGYGEIAAMQILCVVTCPLSAWGFGVLKSMDGNLVPLNFFGLNIVDSILLTVLGTLALSSFFTFFSLFGKYVD